MWWRELQGSPRGDSFSGSSPREVIASASAIVSPAATLDVSRGAIVIGACTKICAGAHLEGPIAIGDDCLIGNLAMVRGATTIGSGTRVGFATEIKNALIGERVTIGPQCFVADSKIEEDAYLGAQVRTSNHRLDKRTVEIMIDGERFDTGFDKLGCLIGARAALGIQVIIFPGREIAPDSIFGPRTTVEKNLPSGRYRLAQQLENF